MKFCTSLVATLLASASAAPRINTDDNNIRMEVDSGKDVEFMQMGGFATSISELIGASASTAAELSTATEGLNTALAESIETTAQTLRTTLAELQTEITEESDSRAAAAQLLANEVNAALSLAAVGTARTLAAASDRITSLEADTGNDFHDANSMLQLRVNVSRRVASGGFSSFTRHQCSYTSIDRQRGATWHRIDWTNNMCKQNHGWGGLPRTGRGCETTLGWTSQSGPDESYSSFLPGDGGGPRITWKCSGCTSNPNVRSNYYCFGNGGTGAAGDGDCVGDTCTADEYMAMAVRVAQPQLAAAYPFNITGSVRTACTANFDDVNFDSRFYAFSAENCTGNALPEGLCDTTVRPATSSPESVVLYASNPLDVHGAGLHVLPSGTGDNSVAELEGASATAIFTCYRKVNLTYNVQNNTAVQPTQTVHRCKVPDNDRTYIRSNGVRSDHSSSNFRHVFQDSQCTNGLPLGDCDAMLSKISQDGEDEGYMVYPPSEGGARIEWIVANPGASQPPQIEVLYMCYRQQPRAYSRHTCTARGRGGRITYNRGHCSCKGAGCVDARMTPAQRIQRGAKCDAHESWQRQMSYNNRGDEDWRAHPTMITWWNSQHVVDAYTRIVVYCYNQ